MSKDLYNSQHFTHDAAVATFCSCADGVEENTDGSLSVDWDKVETVVIDDPPRANAFDTDTFYRLPATVAKPIKQPYHYGEDSLVWLKKPREELKKAAWSLDNAPVALDHPETTMVKDVSDVHGFWNDTFYIDSSDDLRSFAHIPVNDEDAKEHIEENQDVSVGFYNKIARLDEYDGIVGGGDDEDDIDGYQTNMVFDHCAFLGTGRCSSEHGCGLDDAPSHGRGHVAVDGDDGTSFKYGVDITDISENSNPTDDSHSMKETTDAPSGIYTEDGEWYGISPSENPDGDEPKYPLNSCNDVKDAWNLRGSGDYTIEKSTLESRIQRVSDSKDCPPEYRPWENKDIMPEIEIDLDDLEAEAAIDRLAEQHEGVSEVTDELQELREVSNTVEKVTDEIDIELSEVPEKIDELTDKAEQYEEIMQERMESDAADLAELTDRFEDADEVLEAYDSREDIQDRIELLEDAVETSATTTDSGTDETVDSPEEELTRGREVPEAWK